MTSGTFDDFGFDGPGTVSPILLGCSIIDVSQYLLATLIAGPSAAEVINNDPSNQYSADEKCAINGSEADCTLVMVMEGVTTTEAIIETASAFEIQGGGRKSSRDSRRVVFG